MRTQAHRIVDTDPKRGNVVVRLTDPPRRARRRSAKNAAAPLDQSREAHHSARPLHSPGGDPCAMAARYLGRQDLGRVSEVGGFCEMFLAWDEGT
jgi:hypothetical protein